MAGIVNVVKDCRTSDLTRIVDDYVSKTQHTLRDASLDGNILNLAQRNIPGSSRNKPGIYLHFCIRNGVANHVPSDMVVGRNQKKCEREWD